MSEFGDFVSQVGQKVEDGLNWMGLQKVEDGMHWIGLRGQARNDLWSGSAEAAPTRVENTCLALASPNDRQTYAQAVREGINSNYADFYHLPKFEVTNSCEVTKQAKKSV
jgi:hypothetical protein